MSASACRLATIPRVVASSSTISPSAAAVSRFRLHDWWVRYGDMGNKCGGGERGARADGRVFMQTNATHALSHVQRAYHTQ